MTYHGPVTLTPRGVIPGAFGQRSEAPVPTLAESEAVLAQVRAKLAAYDLAHGRRRATPPITRATPPSARPTGRWATPEELERLASEREKSGYAVAARLMRQSARRQRLESTGGVIVGHMETGSLR